MAENYATTMLLAILEGENYPPPDVPNTAANKKLWDDLKANVDRAHAQGYTVEIPFDWADMPDD